MKIFRRLVKEPEGWWLANADELHRQAPRSFFIPPLERRRALAVGETAKLLFTFQSRTADGFTGTGERMWVEVIEVGHDGRFTGRLANNPRLLIELSLGDRVRFGPEHVIAIEYTDEELGYSPGDPVVIDSQIVEDDRPPTQVMSARPPDSDCDMWFAGFDEVPAPERRRTVSIGELTDRWPELEVVFRSSGGRWRRVDVGYVEREPPPS